MARNNGLPFVLHSPYDAGFRARLEGCTRDAPNYASADLTREWIRGYDAAQSEVSRNALWRQEAAAEPSIY